MAVSESISSSMTSLSYTGLSVLVFDISPDSHTEEDHLSSMFHSVKFDELAPKFYGTRLLHIERAQKYVLTFISGFPRAFRCSRGKHGLIPHAVS